MIAKMIPPGRKVADIGTDHAHLPIYLIERGICSEVIATEIRIGPYTRAVENLRRAGLEKVVDLRYGAGFSPLAPREAEVAVVAGMGGEAIAGIIRDEMSVAKAFDIMLLQPMTHHGILRQELYTLDYEIIDEDIAKEGRRFYEIIVAKPGTAKTPDCIDLVVGPLLRHSKNPLVLQYLEHRANTLERLIRKVGATYTASGQSALGQYQEELKLLREVIV